MTPNPGYCWKCNYYEFHERLDVHRTDIGRFQVWCHLRLFICKSCGLIHACSDEYRLCTLLAEYAAIWQGYTCQETLEHILKSCNINYYVLAQLCKKSDKTANRWMRHGIPKHGFNWQAVSDFVLAEIARVQESAAFTIASLGRHDM